MDDLQYLTKTFPVKIVADVVLNLVINGWPSIHSTSKKFIRVCGSSVLNLVINGWPSILNPKTNDYYEQVVSFKPCYKWMTFNTQAN